MKTCSIRLGKGKWLLIAINRTCFMQYSCDFPWIAGVKSTLESQLALSWHSGTGGSDLDCLCKMSKVSVHFEPKIVSATDYYHIITNHKVFVKGHALFSAWFGIITCAAGSNTPTETVFFFVFFFIQPEKLVSAQAAKVLLDGPYYALLIHSGNLPLLELFIYICHYQTSLTGFKC